MSLDVSLYFDIPGSDGLTQTVFEYNITHNLIKMASECNVMLYKAIWRPEELFKEPKAKDILNYLKLGFFELKREPEQYKKFEPENRWGTYEGFMQFLELYVSKCEAYPEAKVYVRG